jgi:hypothetical protein
MRNSLGSFEGDLLDEQLHTVTARWELFWSFSEANVGFNVPSAGGPFCKARLNR